MALELKRVTNQYECLRCHVTKEIIAFGDYYYEDDVDGLIVDFKYYYDTVQAQKFERAQYEIERALDVQEYTLRMKEAEKQFLTATLFDRELKADNLHVSDNMPPSYRGGR